MATEGASMDSERAARYVATARPAMATAWFTRTDGYGKSGGPKDDGGNVRRSEEDVRHTTTVLLNEGDHIASAEEGGLPKEAKEPATTIPIEAMINDVDDKALDTEPDEGGVDVTVVRAAHKLAQKQRKRARVKEVLATRRAAAREELQRQAAEERRQFHRRREANEAMEELARRRQDLDNDESGGRGGDYTFHSNSPNEHSAKEVTGSDSVRYTEAEDGLPTAIVSVSGEQRCVKLDSGARFTVAGTEFMQFGDKVQGESPVDYVKGIGGFLLDVVGVWSFKMTFNQEKGARVAAVRMMRKTRLGRGTITSVEVAVTASDGEQGIFLPTTKMGSVLLSATVTVARGGKALVPAINTGKDRHLLRHVTRPLPAHLRAVKAPEHCEISAQPRTHAKRKLSGHLSFATYVTSLG
ncbi:hypothetical protein PInf_014694 [Phytophthora infestans]|nr:hypothetical protein PInf_014694 [Phytophthora infestans]